MKRFLFLLISIAGYGLNAQDYKPMLESVNEWHLTNCYGGCMTDVYYTDGDTIFNNQPHKILEGYHYISRSFLLREEVEQKKVFLTKFDEFNHVDEYLLYDFSVSVGDTIQMFNPITPFPADAGFFKLDSIRSINLVNDIPHRHFYFTPTQSNEITDYNVVWIEGVGSLSMITAPGGKADINGAGKLSCLFKNNDLVYENLDSISGCQSVMKIKETDRFNKKPELFFKRKTKSYQLKGAENIKLIQFYDLNGKLIQQQKVDTPQTELILNKILGPTGIYILRVILRDEKVYTYKLQQW